MKNIATLLLASSISLLSVSAVMADADIANQTGGAATSAITHVDLCVVVPEILIFGVGATGDGIAKLQWTSLSGAPVADTNDQTYAGSAGAFASPNPFGTDPTASITSNGGGGTVATNIATLPVFLFSNNATDINLVASVSGGTAGGGVANVLELNGAVGTTIPIADFTIGQAAGTGPVITQPALTGAAQNIVNAGIFNSSGDWTYEYNPSAILAAGKYEARITYTATQI